MTADESNDAEPAPATIPIAPPALRLSGWAIAALFCSLGVFCPPLTLIGPMLGFRALVHIRADSTRTGRGMAISAIVIGLLATAFWVSAIPWWQINIRQPMLDGPAAALEAGFGGDAGLFLAEFQFEGQAADEREAVAFLRELSRRHGRFLSCEQDRSRDASSPDKSIAAFRLPYILRFERGDIEAEALFVAFSQGRLWPVSKWRWIRIIDPAQDDLVFPRSMSAEASAPPSTSPSQSQPAGP